MKFPLLPLFIASLLLNVFFVFRTKTSQPRGTPVVGVIDGDTIVLDPKTRVRLRHIDAPDKGMCGYEQATKALEDFTRDQQVTISELIPDQYGRGMALVYVGEKLINSEMIATGWVRYHSDASSETDALKAVAELAKQEKRGIFGLCHSTENTKKPSCTIKGNIDKNSSKNNKKYYLRDCAQYAYTIVEQDIGEDWFCTEKEAVAAGFIKAETCN